MKWFLEEGILHLQLISPYVFGPYAYSISNHFEVIISEVYGTCKTYDMSFFDDRPNAVGLPFIFDEEGNFDWCFKGEDVIETGNVLEVNEKSMQTRKLVSLLDSTTQTEKQGTTTFLNKDKVCKWIEHQNINIIEDIKNYCISLIEQSVSQQINQAGDIVSIR